MSLVVDTQPEQKAYETATTSQRAQPLRVCFLIDDLDVAGTEKHLVSLINRFDRQEVVPYLCLLNGQGELSQGLEPKNCVVHRLGVRSLRSLQAVKAMKEFVKWLKSNKMDVLQTVFPDSTYFGVPAAKIAGVPVVLRTRRNTGYWMNTKHRLLGRLISRLTTATIANSHACKQSVVEDERARLDSVFVISNGVDLDRFQQHPSQKIRTDQTRRIGAVANCRPVKNLPLFIQAAAQIAKKHPKIIFQVAGDGPCRSELQAEIDRLELTDRFQLLGSIPNIAGFLKSLDIAVLCSRSEGISNSLIEYKAAGLPIVATDVGGNSQLIIHEKEGVLVPSESVTELTKAIDRLLCDPTLAKKLGSAARASAEKDHSSRAEVVAYQQLYQRLYEQKLGASSQ